MTYNFTEEIFEEDIRKKALWGLRATAVKVIEFDPTFSTGEYEYIINRLKKEVPEVFVEYKVLPNERDFQEDENSWDEKYFLNLTFYLQENFCLERIENIKRVGKKVYGQQKVNSVQEAESKQKKNETKRIETRKTFIQPPKTEKTQRRKKKDTPALGKIMLFLVVIAGILIAVFQNFQN